MAAPMRVACVILAVSLILAILLGMVTQKEIRSKVFRIILLLAIQLALGFGSYHTWTKTLQAFPRSQSTSAVRWAGLVFALTSHSYVLAYVFLVGENPHWFGIFSFACLGFYVHFLLCFTLISLMNWLRSIILKIDTNFVAPRKALLISVFYSLNVGLLGLYTASRLPEINNVNISLKRLPPSMDGFKIIQINDIHLGATVGRNRLDGIVDIVNSLDGDIIVIVGDLVDQTVDKLHLAAAPLKRLQSRYGTYFVTGNHEYYMGGVDAWFVKLQELGINILHNDHVEIRRKEKPDDFFYLAGVDDLQGNVIQYDGHGMDLDKAMESCDDEHTVVLLAHQPWSAKMALDSKYTIDLVLSGHTHGGQMFPFTVLVYLTNPFFLGLYEYNGGQVFVSEGTVFWGIPMRIGTSMEITSISLHH